MRNYNDNHDSMYSNIESSRSGSESDNTVIIDLTDSSPENTDNEFIDTEEDDHDDDDDPGIEYDSIHNEDSFHFYSEKEHGKYYIGLCHKYTSPNFTQWLLSTSVSAQSFYRHTYDKINNYLYYYGLVRVPRHQIQIMQVHRVPYDTCAVIIKTYWLRLVQRHWKRTWAQRKSVILRRMSPHNQLYRQIHGKYPRDISMLPTIKGMLSVYATATL